MANKRYRIKKDAPEHYIGNRFVKPGDVFELPKGVKPGQYLEEVSEREARAAEAAGEEASGESA